MEFDRNSRGDCFFCWAWNLESILDTLIDYGCEITSVTPVTYIWLPFFTFALRYSITYVQPLYDDDDDDEFDMDEDSAKSEKSDAEKSKA